MVLHGQQDRRLDEPRPRAVHPGAEHDRRSKDRQANLRVVRTELPGDVLDLELVCGVREIEVGPKRRLLCQRNVVVGMSSIRDR
jgi:hypothetical protein